MHIFKGRDTGQATPAQSSTATTSIEPHENERRNTPGSSRAGWSWHDKADRAQPNDQAQTMKLGHPFKPHWLGGPLKFGPVSESIAVVQDLFNTVSRVSETQKEYKELQEKLESLLQQMNSDKDRDLPSDVVSSIEKTCGLIKLEILEVEAKLKRGGSKRVRDVDLDDTDIKSRHLKFQGYIQELSRQIEYYLVKAVDDLKSQTGVGFSELGAKVQLVPAAVVRELNNVDLIQKLKHALKPVDSALYNSGKGSVELKRGPCTSNTRTEVLNAALRWVDNLQAASVYWIHGMAGTGKTTIFYSLCEILKEQNKLAGSFFCARKLTGCGDVTQILPSIAYQLGLFSPPYADELNDILRGDPTLPNRDLKTQLQTLIVNPLRCSRVQEALPTVLVVVVDALDECGERDGANELLSLLLAKDHLAPLKFIISSRPDQKIQEELGNLPNSHENQFDLHDVRQETVQSDIRKYLVDAFHKFRERLDRADSGSKPPTHKSQIQVLDENIDKLARRSGQLLIYAATAVSHITNKTFTDQLPYFQRLLNESDTTTSRLDQLYTTILKEAFGGDRSDDGRDFDLRLDAEDKNVMRLVLDTIVCAQEPLTILNLDHLLGLESPDRVLSALGPLSAVLHITEPYGPVAIIHTSFQDFMIDHKRSKAHHCDTIARHTALAQWCFDRIQQATPKFNICNLESSHQRDDDIKNIDQRLFKCLEGFLSCDLLLWMEVLNLKKAINTGPGILHRVVEYCREYSTGLFNLANDAEGFVTSFAANPVSQSTPHIYISMLVCWPPSAPISKYYRPHMRGMVKMGGKVVRVAKPALLAEWPLHDEGNAAAFLSDGNSIVVASGKRLQILDLFTGREISGSAEVHKDVIKSVDTSRDGGYIVSGSADNSVRLWESSQCHELKTLARHEECVYAVAFSPDSKFIASGSGDKLIYVWDVTTGNIAQTLQGHEGSVYAVKFSPDGKSIVSSSDDWTVRVWDIETGAQKLGPPKFAELKRIPDLPSLKAPVVPDYRTLLSRMQKPLEFKIQKDSKRHDSLAAQLANLIEQAPKVDLSHAIFSVGFSPDEAGSQIVSGCRDGTIRLWSSGSGNQKSSFRETRYPGSILCTAFTPDGTHVISGSADGTVCVWNVAKGRLVLGPLIGHQGIIKWVGCSADGIRIFSVSTDKTIRVWDLRGELPTSVMPQSSAIRVLGFSRDGRKIVSGSDDSSIQLWDAQSGRQIDKAWYNSGSNRSSTRRTKIHSAAVSLDGTQILYAVDNKLYRWDRRGQKKTEMSCPGRYYPAFSHDNKQIAASTDKTIYVLDKLGQVQGSITECSRVTSISYSPNELRIAAGLENGSIGIWVVDGTPTRMKPPEGHKGEVTSVAFSSNGKLLASSARDLTIRISSLESVNAFTVQVHTGPVHHVSFAPNSKHVISASDDGICLWDVKTGEKFIGPLSWQTRFVKAAMPSPNGSGIVSGFDDGSVAIWNLEDSDPLGENNEPILAQRTAWSMQGDGWITDEDGLLVWIPHDLRPAILPARVTVANYFNSRVRLGFNGAFIGKSWSDCYQPELVRAATGSVFWQWSKACAISWYHSLAEAFKM